MKKRLQKRIRERLLTCGYEPFLTEVDSNVLLAIQRAVEEMRKEFPWKIHTDEDLDAIEIWKRLVLERDKWYVKWLGGE